MNTVLSSPSTTTRRARGPVMLEGRLDGKNAVFCRRYKVTGLHGNGREQLIYALQILVTCRLVDAQRFMQRRRGFRMFHIRDQQIADIHQGRGRPQFCARQHKPPVSCPQEQHRQKRWC